MTRARRSLAVMSNDNHEYLPTQSPAVLIRQVTPDPASFRGPRRIYQSAEARLVDLSFAGRQRAGHPSLAAIAEARIGDGMTLVRDGGRWLLHDAKGRVLGRMSKSFVPPSGTRFARGEIAAILHWRKEDGDEAFHHTLRRVSWEVVLPELVFERVE